MHPTTTPAPTPLNADLVPNASSTIRKCQLRNKKAMAVMKLRTKRAFWRRRKASLPLEWYSLIGTLSWAELGATEMAITIRSTTRLAEIQKNANRSLSRKFNRFNERLIELSWSSTCGERF